MTEVVLTREEQQKCGFIHSTFSFQGESGRDGSKVLFGIRLFVPSHNMRDYVGNVMKEGVGKIQMYFSAFSVPGYETMWDYTGHSITHLPRSSLYFGPQGGSDENYKGPNLRWF